MATLATAISRGLASARPTFGSDQGGALYYSTDTAILEQWNGTSWATVATALALGTTGTTAAAGNDARLSDARTPTAHKTSHESGGGDAIAAANIAGFDTQVRTNRLDQMAVPTADVSLNTHKLTGVVDPTSAQDAATKAYVDALAQGLQVKAPVRAATTANGTLASAFENGDTIDGVTLVTGDRILLKDQTTGSQNGIYTVNASGAPTRATDMDISAEVKGGLFVLVQEGTANADRGFVLTNDGAITLGTTALVFAQLSSPSSYTEGAGIDITGNVVAIDIPSLSAVTPDAADYLVIYDTSASAHKKALISGLPGGGGASDAEDVTYDPTASGLTAIDVQAAIDEIVAGGGVGGVGGPAIPYTYYPPDGSDFATWVNQAAAVADVGARSFRLYRPNRGGTGSETTALVKAVPGATPWEITAKVAISHGNGTTDDDFGGLVLRDSASGKMKNFAIVDRLSLNVTKYGSATSWVGKYTNEAPMPYSPVIDLWLRIADDGTNLTYSYSFDGALFIQVEQHGRTDYMTANQIGVAVGSRHGDSAVWVSSWQGDGYTPLVGGGLGLPLTVPGDILYMAPGQVLDTDVALTSIPSDSAHSGTDNAAKLIDANGGTYWSTVSAGGSPSYAQFDLGHETEIYRFGITQFDATQYLAVTIKLQGSNGGAWTDIPGTAQTAAGSATFQDWSFTPITYRYIRFVILTDNGMGGTGVKRFSLYATGDDPAYADPYLAPLPIGAVNTVLTVKSIDGNLLPRWA